MNHGGGGVSAANLLPSSFVVAVNNLPKKYLEDDVRGLLAAEKTHVVEITIEVRTYVSQFTSPKASDNTFLLYFVMLFYLLRKETTMIV